ncbi:MAG: hypothetical protein GY757_17610 [bacterium]|nr:hypothetical protein [bacterium]
MKRKLLGLILFALFLFSFDRGLFYLLSKLETYVYSNYNKDFEERFGDYLKDKKYSTLILGTSRTFEGIHPCYFRQELKQEAFKESFQGKGPAYNYFFYQLYKKYQGVPRVVVYGIDYFVFTIDSDPMWMTRFPGFGMADSKTGLFSSPLNLMEQKKKIDIFQNNLLTILRGKSEFKNRAEQFERIQNHTGVGFKASKKLVTKKPARGGRKWRKFYTGFPGREGEFLVKLLKELEKDNVTVILVGLPDYFGTFKTNFQRKAFVKEMKGFTKNYKNVFFYNYNRPDLFPLRNPDYFFDGGFGMTNSHLSQKGAEHFNLRLLKDIKKHYKRD